MNVSEYLNGGSQFQSDRLSRNDINGLITQLNYLVYFKRKLLIRLLVNIHFRLQQRMYEHIANIHFVVLILFEHILVLFQRQQTFVLCFKINYFVIEFIILLCHLASVTNIRCLLFLNILKLI
jgi:hypothetical protein